MKKQILIPAGLLLITVFVFNSCKKKSTDEITATPTPTSTGVSYGTPTAVGTSIGTSVSGTFGSTGGTLFSADGRLEIIIPANALAASTNIGIQPITNTAFGGAGAGYNLTPNGQQFNQPVIIRFHYDITDVRGTSPLAFGIAFQKSNNIWYLFNTSVLDTVNKTKSVTTTHFTSYSLFDEVLISPEHDVVELSTVSPIVLKGVKKATDDDSTDTVTPIEGLENYSAATQIHWSVNGVSGGDPNDGSVSPVSGSGSVNYTSPISVSFMGSNPAQITAAVISPELGNMDLTSSILVVTTVSGAHTYDVVVDYTASGLDVAGDNVISYIDQATFTVIINTADTAFTIYPSDGITNSSGLITGLYNTSPGCTVTSNTGDLLHIDSVMVIYQLDSLLQLTVISTFIPPDFVVTCPGLPPVVTTYPSIPAFRAYTDSLVHIGAIPMTVTTVGTDPGEVVTYTITPQ